MSPSDESGPQVVALAGGVGGARLVDGLDQALPRGALSVVVNTGDDFLHWGLHVSPDLDTIMYTLAGLAPEDRGWGIDDDTFEVLAEAARRGLDDWFQLGDRDLVTHVVRTRDLARGRTLTQATADLCASLGVERTVLPMSDGPQPTSIVTATGEELAFQRWLVHQRAAPGVREVRLGGADEATPEALDALRRADLIVLCPSNPFVSIDPVLRLRGVREAIATTKTVAVSPILNGRAVKGPLGTMLPQLEGQEPSAEAVALHYRGLLNGYAVQHGDGFDADYAVLETNILIQSRKDRLRLAREILGLARNLS